MAVMMSPREKWTDERLDDLQQDMNRRFDSVDATLVRVERRFENLETRMDARSERIDARFDGLTRTLIGSAAAIVAALIGSSIFG